MKRFAPPLVLLVAIIAAMGPLLVADFTLWDDPSTIWQNPSVLNFSVGGLLDAWTSSADSIYMPLTRTAWMILGVIAGGGSDTQTVTLHPTVFHAANVAVHCVAAGLVYRVLRKFSLPAVAALIGALLFAVHPIQVEPVGWASGLKDVLAGALALAGLNAYVDALRIARLHQNANAVGAADAARIRVLSSLALFTLSVLAKPTALVTPAILFVVATGVFERPWRQELKRLVPFILVAVIAAAVATFTQPALVTPSTPLWQRPLVAADAMVFYFRQIVWPAHLGIDYGRTPGVALASTASWIAPAILLVIVTLLAVAWRKQMRLAVVGIATFTLAVFPMLGWTRFDFQYYSTVADHYAYLAMLGIAVTLTAILERYRSRAMVAAASLAVVMLGVRANVQARTWHDSASVATNAIATNPRSAAAHHLLGVDLDRRAEYLATLNRNEEAISIAKAALAEYELALTLNPRHVRSLDDAATSCWRLHKRVDPAEAIVYERRAMDHWRALDALVPTMPISLQSNFVDLPSRLGKLALDLGLFHEAGVYFNRALRLRPDDQNALAGREIATRRLQRTPATTQSATP